MPYTMDTTVFGGLPITVEFTVNGPDYDVGYSGGVDDWSITHVGGKIAKNPQWLYNKISANAKEEERLMQEMSDYADGYDDYYDPAEWRD